ncbi:MAG: DNA repair protein RadA [Anaerolineales bacterium]|nr:MAG: DNA repair protein RadA [Anaerolineales bacterium]
MAKSKTQYTCQQCGRVAAKPLGRCPQCGSWNSMTAEIVALNRAGPRSLHRPQTQAVRLADVEGDPEERILLPIDEFARVLGGGVVPGSVVLIGGDPGIGKSTLLLQTAALVARQGPVLYVSGEESERQIKLRSGRLDVKADDLSDLFLLSETDLESILAQVDRLGPRLLVIDSIQTMHIPEIESSAGSITQVRECASRLQAMAKQSGVAVFLVGHVTKEGAIAGPRVLEHIVDTVLYLEGDPYHAYRLLRSVKNRFGPTSEVGVFEMQSTGLVEVSNPSEALLAERVVNAPGSAVAVTMEGTRPLLVEIQGLTSRSSFGNPRRTANGVDLSRLLLIAAVLSRRAGVPLLDEDIFVNVVGGLRIGEPAADLAMAIALASSHRDRVVPADMLFVGEIGLSGELRAVPQLPARLGEAAKLGFRRALIPKQARIQEDDPKGIELLRVRSLEEGLKIALGSTS